jgi:hypothetical protein
MNTLTNGNLAVDLLARIEAAGLGSNKDDIKATFQRMALKLQEGYTGRLYAMIPQDASCSSPDLKRWAKVYAFVVLDVCQKHGRTIDQVNSALTAVLPE